MPKTTTTTSTKNTVNLSDFTFAVKTRGSASADGSTATYNKTTRRLTLGVFYYNAGYRSGKVGLDKNGNVIVALSKNGYDKANAALHSTQYFITVVKNSPAIAKLDTARKYDVVALSEGVLKLTPQK